MTQNLCMEPLTDTTYCEAEREHLRLRLHRIETERLLIEAEREAIESPDHSSRRQAGVPELRGTLHTLHQQERRVRQEIDDTLAAHRADPDAKTLGIDQLGLVDEDDRLVILALLLASLSRRWTDDLVPGVYCASPTVDDIVVAVLGARDVEAILRGRARFRPGSPLRQAGVMVEPPGGNAHAGTLPESMVWLSIETMSTILDPDALVELHPDDDEAGS